VYTTDNSDLPDNSIQSLAVDPHGNIWVGTFGGGLAEFDGRDWTVYNPLNSGLPYNWVQALAVDSKGNIWAGTYRAGLAKFDGENWTVYNTSNSGLPYDNVTALVVDSEDNLWVGTCLKGLFPYGGGLAKFDGEEWTVYNTWNSGLPSNGVLCLAVDHYGNLWIGTDAGGLGVYRKGGVILPGVTEVKEQIREVPSEFGLLQNYPNPFNSFTTIPFFLPKNMHVRVAVYDVLGRFVRKLAEGEFPSGEHRLVWDGRDEEGVRVGSGVYLYRVETGREVRIGRMAFVK